MELVRDGVSLSCEVSGSGAAVVCLHGLTATRRYVVMGSRALERSGRRVVLYDARGHGLSSPAPRYDYAALAGDLRAVLDRLDIASAVIAGASMGAHTAVRFALEAPDRVAGLALITPAFDPATHPENLAAWDALARGLRERGTQGFIDAYDFDAVPEQWRSTLRTVLRQRLDAHRHPHAVADALVAVPRSEPFATLSELAAIVAPTLVVGSRDEADPGHPLSVARAYAEAIPGAELVHEQAGHSPLAWQGGQLSRLITAIAYK